MHFKINVLSIFQDSILKYITIKSRSVSPILWGSGFIVTELFLNVNMIVIQIYKLRE